MSCIIAGNWKMHGLRADAAAQLAELRSRVGPIEGRQVVICPPFTLLAEALDLLAGTPIQLGGQDCFWRASGAFTGQISPAMLADAGCRWVIVGHSERRGRFGSPLSGWEAGVLDYFADSDETVSRKLAAALEAGLKAICCVGETLPERSRGEIESVVRGQVEAALKHVTPGAARSIVFAYEPVWAIGTGEVCSPQEAQRVCEYTASVAGSVLSGARIPVLYGGSVKPDNAAALLAQPSVGGVLVGGASLKAGELCAIIDAAHL